jgi:hypothetical protein
MILKPPRGAILNRTHPLARGLVGCWLFNEWTGNTARDSVSGLIATGVNAPTWDGMGMRFTAASNQYLTLNAISGFNPEKGTIYFRGVWDGPATSSKDYIIFSIYTSSTDRFFFEVETFSTGGYPSTSTSPEFSLGYDGSSTSLRSCFTSIIVSGTYYSAVVQWGSGYINAWLNGILNHTVTRDSAPTISGSTVWNIGGYNNSNGLCFQGAMECLYFFNTELSASAIQSLDANPYAMFESESPAKRFFDIGGAASVVGSRFIYSDIFPVTQLFRGNNL